MQCQKGDPLSSICLKSRCCYNKHNNVISSIVLNLFFFPLTTTKALSLLSFKGKGTCFLFNVNEVLSRSF